MASINLETDIIKALRSKPMTVPKLADAIKRHQHTVRPVVYDLVKRGILRKGKFTSGYPTYTVDDDLQRVRPLLRVYSKDVSGLVYTGLETFLRFAGKRTKAAEAVDYLPQVVSKLLMIGFKYNTIKDQWLMEAGDDELLQTRLKPLRRDLRLLRVEYSEHFKALDSIHDLFTQLETNNDFWDLEQLGYHFNKQVNFDGNLIAPIDSHTVVESSTLY